MFLDKYPQKLSSHFQAPLFSFMTLLINELWEKMCGEYLCII